MKKPHTTRPQYIPTLTNEQIKELPVWPDHRKHDLALTETGKQFVQDFNSLVWRNPFGEPK